MHNQDIHGPKIQISRENLIGNSDMHHGNFAFWMDAAPPLPATLEFWQEAAAATVQRLRSRMA
jgi:hypothetical protein